MWMDDGDQGRRVNTSEWTPDTPATRIERGFMHHFRSHLTFANVVSLIALFVALGGTAAASVIISSNSQVAQNTISGHKPPSGDHPNLIAGSVNGQDLAAGSVS